MVFSHVTWLVPQVEQQSTGVQDITSLGPQQLEINPSHPIMVGLNTLRTGDEDTAKLIAEQVVDNALVSAGLMDDGRSMVTRINSLVEMLIKSKASS